MRADPREWEELRLSISIDPNRLMRLCQVTPRTWRRWKTHGPPAGVMALARALAADLAPHGWPGWSLQGELLWPPGARTAREAYRMEDVDWIPMARWIIDGHQRVARDQQQQSAALAAKSEPALDCMRRMRDGLNQACAAYDELRGMIGGRPRVFEERRLEERRRGWW